MREGHLKAMEKEKVKEKVRKCKKERTKAAGAAGGVKLQGGVAVPSTAPEPEFKVFFFSMSGNRRQPEEQCVALRGIRQDSGVGSPCAV